MTEETRRETITLESLRPRTFDKTSPVTAYWLTRCDGFQIAGLRGRVTVERTVYYDDPLDPVALRVRNAGNRRWLIPIDDVEGVSPLQGILYVRLQPSFVRRSALKASAALPLLRAGGDAAIRAVHAASPWVRRGLALAIDILVLIAILLGTAVLAAARLLALTCSRIGRWLAPHGARLAGASIEFGRRALR